MIVHGLNEYCNPVFFFFFLINEEHRAQQPQLYRRGSLAEVALS